MEQTKAFQHKAKRRGQSVKRPHEVRNFRGGFRNVHADKKATVPPLEFLK